MTAEEQPLSSPAAHDGRRAAAEAAVNDILQGAWKARAVHAAVDLGIPELLEKGPRPVAELAAASGADESALRRLLVLLSTIGIFRAEDDGETFGHSGLSEVLLPDPASPVATDARFQAAPWHWRAWEQLTYSIRTGKASFEEANGTSFWDLTRDDDTARELFNRAMGSVSLAESRQVAAAYDFSGSRLVVDIGGGRGSMLAAVLDTSPRTRGILLERPAVAEEARELLDGRGLLGRCEIVPGDFFTTVPDGADLYLIKHVLHDWTDADIVAILRRVHDAMTAESTLLVIDNLLDDRPTASTLCVDLLLLVLVGGAERSLAGFTALLAQAGLAVRRSFSCGPGPLRLVEIRRAD
ncbi:methyltransferase [Streptomyces gamaensis]|uniref:Methyltransferase n=1 Tax=Streptomyces gamaensis TaxID=1763542 RepID=A0ABW0Z8K8_9ACTN